MFCPDPQLHALHPQDVAGTVHLCPCETFKLKAGAEMVDLSDDETFRRYREAMIVLLARKGRRHRLGSVDPEHLKAELGISHPQYQELLHSLNSDGFIGRGEIAKVALSESGKSEAERIESDSTFRRPLEQSAPQTVVNNVYGASNSVIQQGGHGAKQTAQGDWSVDQLAPIVQEIRDRLDDMSADSDRLDEIRVQLDTLEPQLQAKSPVKAVVRATGDALATAMRRAGGALGEDFAQRIEGALPPG
jgi:hypothetical protein